MNEPKELFEQRKKEIVDPYGLTTKTMNGTEINLSETTPYDSFALNDSLRLIKYSIKIEEFKAKNIDRFNKETGLYEVTIGDNNTDYYEIATLLNRMTNTNYAKKVATNASLIRDIIAPIKSSQTKLNNQVDSLSGQNYPTDSDNRTINDLIDKRIDERKGY